MRSVLVALLLQSCALPVSLFASESLAERSAGSVKDGSAQLSVLRLGPEQGLAHNAVRAILQDHLGFLWLGTEDGLQRFDGLRFETFRPDSSELPLSHTRVNRLLELEDGSLWVGTAGGADVISSDRREIRRIPFEKGGYSVASLTSTPAGQVIVGTTDQGLLLVDPVQRELEAQPVGNPGWHVVDVEFVSERLRVLILSEGFFEEWVLNAEFQSVERVVLDRENALEDLAADAARLRRVEARYVEKEGLWFERTGTEADGEFKWSGTHAGLFLEGSREQLSIPMEFVSASSGLPLGDEALTQEVLALELDSFGSLWIGTWGGLLRADPVGGRFQGLPLGSTEDYAVSSVSSVARASSAESETAIWAGTFGSGVLEIDLGDGRLRRRWLPSVQSEGQCDDYVWSLLGDSTHVLVVTRRGICRFGPNLALMSFERGSSYRHAFRHGAEQVVVTGNRTLILDAEGQEVRAMEVAAEAGLSLGSAVWLAGRVLGGSPGPAELLRLHPPSGESERFPLGREASIYDMVLGRNPEELLLATTDGLLSFDTESGASEVVIPSQTIGTVYSILRGTTKPPGAGSAAPGSFWLGTGRGLVRLADGEAALVESFDVRDGLGNVEFNRRATLRLASGWAFLGGMTGVTSFDLSEWSGSTVPAPTRFVRATIEGERGERVVEPGSIVMSPSDFAVGLEFANLSFVRGDLNRYRHRLVGADQGWVESGNQRRVRYAGLRPGEYTFEALGANRDGVWSLEPAKTLIVVQPPFYSTWWFRAAVVALLAAVLAVAYHLRMRRLLETERMRLRIATDLHDELGSELSGIALASAIVGRSQHLDASERSRLEDVEGTARQVMEGLRDIVWYVNPEHDSTVSMVDRMRSTAERLAGDLELSFEALGLEREIPLDMRARRQLQLILKELLTNAVRHSQGSRLHVNLERTGRWLELAVEDDGRGMPENVGCDGSGMQSVRRRAEALGGQLELGDAPIGGLSARVYVPL